MGMEFRISSGWAISKTKWGSCCIIPGKGDVKYQDMTCTELRAKLVKIGGKFEIDKREFRKGLAKGSHDIADWLKLELEKFKKLMEKIQLLVVDIEPLGKEFKMQYEETLGTFKYFGVVHEDTNSPGEYRYVADYDGSEEKGGRGVDFSGRVYKLPNFNEVLERITPQMKKTYLRWKKAGLEPKLRITPLAYSIRTLAKKLDEKKHEGHFFQDSTYVDIKVVDHELVYEADTFEAIDDGKELKTTGGTGKSEFILKYGGWLIAIEQTKQNPAADFDKIKDQETGIEYTNAQKVEFYLGEMREKGERGFTYEQYAVAMMETLRRDPPVLPENAIYTFLPESLLADHKHMAAGSWNDSRINLFWRYYEKKSAGFRLIRSVWAGGA